MDILGQSSLLVGVTAFALGFSILARNVRNKLFLAFAILTTLVSGWALAFFLDKIWGGAFYRFHLFFNIWLAPAALSFIHVMVRIHDRLSRRLLDVSVLASIGLSVALLLRLDAIPWVLQLIYFAPVVVILQILRLMWLDRRLKHGVMRLPKLPPRLPTVGFGRRNLIYLGGLLVLCTSVMDHVPWLGIGVPSLGNLALTAYLFFLSQAISQQRLLNFSALFSRFLVLVVVALTLTVVYSLLVGWIQDSPGLFLLNSFIASFLILTLLEPLRTFVRYFTQRLMAKEHRQLEQILREAQRRLAGIVDTGTLFQAILSTVEQTIKPQRGALFVLRSDGTKYRRARTIGREQGAEPAIRELLPGHILLQQCEHLHRRGELPVLLDQIIENEIDRSASRVQRGHLSAVIEALRALDANLVIPLFDSGKILAFLALNVSEPPEPWGSNWGLLTIVYPYFEQAALTMHNMEVFVRQREKERLATLGEMAAGLAHEIRNPLGAIKGAAQFLDPSADRPEARFLRVIVEEVDRLNRVVTQFLDYSKPPSADLKPVDLNVLVEKTVEMILPTLDAPMRLEFSPSRSRATVLAASGQIQQVLLNLIQNSVKALETSGGSGHPGASPLIQATVEVAGEGVSREVTVAIEDNGPGIRREHLEKLFIPFFTTSPSGTGLGLSISQKIVEAHRGRIEVASEEGRFARFSMILPAWAAPADQAAEKAAANEPEGK